MCVCRGASNPIKNLIIDSTSDAVVVRKGNHPFKAVPGIQSQRNILYPAWGIPLSLHLLERPIIIFRFSDHIGSVRTPCTLNLTKTMMNRHPHLPYGGDGCYPRYYYEFSANDVINYTADYSIHPVSHLRPCRSGISPSEICTSSHPSPSHHPHPSGVSARSFPSLQQSPSCVCGMLYASSSRYPCIPDRQSSVGHFHSRDSYMNCNLHKLNNSY